ncbi:hypothetical protein FDUTEX481_05291 [Tolypothrix sp. PCC 7601]|nr:hypothetical protein FDUTEX481_05291 [Tolypothrix sp. PCC 7601]
MLGIKAFELKIFNLKCQFESRGFYYFIQSFMIFIFKCAPKCPEK